MCTFGLLGCRVKPRRPHQTGPPGLAHDSPRTPNVHISGPRRFKHHQNSTQGSQEREKEERKLWRRSEKKARNFGLPTLRGPTLRSATFSRFGPPPFGAHPSRAPHFVVPKFNIQKLAEIELAEVEIGRSRIGRTRKKELAEVEIGRSRSPPSPQQSCQ